jgi:hypothetical protein
VRTGLCEHTFVREWSYTLTRHEPGRPWIIVAREHLTVELEDGVAFYEWARQEWPSERFTVELDPWQLS